MWSCAPPPFYCKAALCGKRDATRAAGRHLHGGLGVNSALVKRHRQGKHIFSDVALPLKGTEGNHRLRPCIAR